MSYNYYDDQLGKIKSFKEIKIKLSGFNDEENDSTNWLTLDSESILKLKEFLNGLEQGQNISLNEQNGAL